MKYLLSACDIQGLVLCTKIWKKNVIKEAKTFTQISRMKDHSYGNGTFETFFFTLSNAYYIYSYTINVSNTAYHAHKD